MIVSPTSPAAEQLVEPTYLTVAEVAALLRLSPKSVYRLAAQDPTMPLLKIGGSVRWPRERLLRWLQDHEQGRPRTRKQVLGVVKSAPVQGAARG